MRERKEATERSMVATLGRGLDGADDLLLSSGKALKGRRRLGGVLSDELQERDSLGRFGVKRFDLFRVHLS